MTDWTAVVLVVREDEVDEVSGLVWDLGVSGVEEVDLGSGSIELRIGCDGEVAELVIETLSDRWTVSAESVAADTGLDAWREHAQVWRAGSNIVIVPPWLATPSDLSPDDLVLSIDPGHAFGSASHETTRLCLEAVAEFVKPGSVVADIGCGSGVLAIAAVRLGAREAIATDISPDAIIATIEMRAATMSPMSLTFRQQRLWNSTARPTTLCWPISAPRHCVRWPKVWSRSRNPMACWFSVDCSPSRPKLSRQHSIRPERLLMMFEKTGNGEPLWLIVPDSH